MAEIFAECRRVIKPDGIMTVMFNHKSTAAWDALTVALINAKFAITRTWPVKTESESSIHIKGQAPPPAPPSCWSVVPVTKTRSPSRGTRLRSSSPRLCRDDIQGQPEPGRPQAH